MALPPRGPKNKVAPRSPKVAPRWPGGPNRAQDDPLRLPFSAHEGHDGSATRRAGRGRRVAFPPRGSKKPQGAPKKPKVAPRWPQGGPRRKTQPFRKNTGLDVCKNNFPETGQRDVFGAHISKTQEL